jgi:peptidoglycan/LPS O-acetylase OafA/YrhL
MINRWIEALRVYGFGKQRVIPGLDGLRAISIGFVLLAHLGGTRNFPGFFEPIGRLGSLGVRVFFVISGYLITSILLAEIRRSGNVSLPRFYFRRTMRLFPASYCLIAVVAIAAHWHLLSLERWDLTFASTYTMNYYIGRGWPLGHLWSLAIEEQFYLLWPFTLKALGPRRSVRVLAVILIAGPAFRIFSPYVGPAFNFLVSSDSLAAGCLLALMREELVRWEPYARLLSSRYFFLVPTVAVLADYFPSTKVRWLAMETIMNFGIMATVDWAMRNSESRVGRFLNLPVVAFTGVLSYSLYLWQQLFLNRHSSAPLCAFPVNLLLVFVASLASYLLVEAPSLRLRTAIERRRASRATPARVSS